MRILQQHRQLQRHLLVLALALVLCTVTTRAFWLPRTPATPTTTPWSKVTTTRRRTPPTANAATTTTTTNKATKSSSSSSSSFSDDDLQLRGKGSQNNNKNKKRSSSTSDDPIPVGLTDIVQNLHERTWASLDLHVIQARLAELADTVRAKTLAKSPCFAEDVEEVHRRYKAVEEVWASHQVIPINHPMDIEGAVGYAARGNVLELPELRTVGKTLSVLSNLRGFLDVQPEGTMVQLQAYAEGIALPQELVELLSDAFDDEGRLCGKKFPQLKRLRSEVERLYGSIKNTVGELMKSSGMSEMITDEYIAQRNGRFVLPIKNTYKRTGLGIVHDQSNTGRTVYVEPVQVIEPTNDMKRMELELAQEEARITGEMTRLIAISKDQIYTSLEAAALIDLSVARAKLGDVLQAVVPTVSTEGAISAEDARHPVLVLRGRDPIGNTLHINPQKPGLVLTGPNAGGKTIVLKTLGLLALLVRLGIPVPARRGVRVDFFAPILADIGDMQSVTGDLSTFSGHLLVCREVLSSATAAGTASAAARATAVSTAATPSSSSSSSPPSSTTTGASALVLMDEMGSGTDPAQGVAIAQALLEALLETGARVAITTHYLQLKELAQTDDRFTVGAMEFLEGKPTYRFKEGAIGESYALEVAERLELPGSVLSRARGLMDAGVVKVTELIKELEAQRDALQGEREGAKRREVELGEEKARMDVKMRELEEKQVELDRLKYRAKLEAADQFLGQLQEKEKKLEGLLRNLGLGDERATVESALKELMSVKEQVAEESKPDVVHVPANLVLLKRDDILKEGEIVVCAGDQLNADRSGKVVKASGQNVDVMFSKGGLDIVITFKKTDLARAPAEEVAKLAKAAAGRDKKEKKKKWTKADERNLKLLGDEMSRSSRSSAGPSVSLKAMRTSFNTVDVRGLRLRDAEVKVDAFIKQGIPQGRKCVYILHGHGTGQLKEGLREFMKRHPYVGKHLAADESDGGDAFTQVFMK